MVTGSQGYRANASECNPPEPIADSIADTALRLGISRTTIYSLIGNGQLRSVKLGKRRLIPRDAQRELLASIAAA